MSSDDDFAAIARALPDPFKLLVRDTSTSTNDDLRSLAEAGAPEGLVLLARNQTAGRGRRGASWFSPPGESLAFSVLLRPVEPKALWPRLALAAGLSVAEALEHHLPLAGIKWPNDLVIGGKKIAGILVEAGPGFVIVGIGLNIATTSFPPAVAGIATSLALETGTTVPLPEMLSLILHRLASHRLRIGSGFGDLLAAVRLRCTLTGHRVHLLTPSGPRQGLVQGIGRQGELLLLTESGPESLLQADEIRRID